MFRSLLGMFSNDLSIDLGTANTLIYVRGQGIVLGLGQEIGRDEIRLHLVKLLYERTLLDGRQVKVCKRCRKKDIG